MSASLLPLFRVNVIFFLFQKQRKKRDKGSSNDICKDEDLEKLNASNEIIKGTFTSKENNKKKKIRRTKVDVKDTEGLNILMRNSKDDRKTSEAFQKIQINTGGKIKCKIKNKDKLNAINIERLDVLTKYPRNDQKTSEILQKVQVNTNKRNKKKGRKQGINSNFSNKDAARVNHAKKSRKKPQTSAKESIDYVHKKTKIEKLKKMSEKKMKRFEADLQQMKSDQMLKLNKHMIKIRRLEEMISNKSQAKKALKDKLTMQLRVAKFKFINEILYNNNSLQSKCYFKRKPDAFEAYHAGYKWQLEQWTVNPLDVIISSIRKLLVYCTLSLNKMYINSNAIISQ